MAMDRAAWVNVLKKRFTLVPNHPDSLEGESTYILPEKQFVVIIRAATPAGALRAEAVTDTEECLVVNRGQGKRSFVDWNKIEAICTAEV